MIDRLLLDKLNISLAESPVVALVGPRQSGKTTLARQTTRNHKARFFDLENPTDRYSLENPLLMLRQCKDQLVIIDEAQRMPELFPIIRVLVDEDRHAGRFLLLGSATTHLRRQSAESLAGRLITLELSPLLINEAHDIATETLWERGGFPPSLLADKTSASITWRENYLKDIVERDLNLLGFDLPPERMWRFLRMLAHNHGQRWNAAQLARSLDIGASTAGRYLDTIQQTFLVRRLAPFYRNLGKRLIKAPKVYIRDTGLLHALLGIPDIQQLIANPVAGASWEGFALEQILNNLPSGWESNFWRTSAGAEIDLILLKGGEPQIAIEVKMSSVPRPPKGFFVGCDDLKIQQRWIVYPGTEQLLLPQNVTALPLLNVVKKIRSL